MAEKNYTMQAVVPEAPRTIDEQQLYVYVPQGSTSNFGVFKPDGKQFVITADGVLRVDASKLIQLATPSAQVVEDGGETSVEVQFTETDHTLLRQFQFIFKNIKGPTGATGLAALECSYVKTANKQPSPTEQINIPFNTFNRTPLSGEVVTCYYVDSTTSINYLIKAGIISISGDHAVCYIDSVFKLTGDKGANSLTYSGTYVEEYEGDLNDEPINLPLTNFSRDPKIDDTFLLVYSVTETGNVYIAVMSVKEVGTENVKCALVVDTVNLIRGPQGATGADGVSITSVTQTGVQGGTLVTITLSNGQSTSFTVYNGINTNFQVVDELPTENISTSTIYLILSDVQSEDNIYDEYIYVNGNWEHIGSTSVDLSDYVTKTYFNQNVGDATKNYIVAQLAKVHNLYIEMYESGSVPEVGQALTLTNANFARVPTVNQYFGLLEVVNTKDKYYSICQVLSVDTTTCSAKVVAVTELDNGTEIDSIKASIATLTTQLSGKADASALNAKLDKVATATATKQAYVKNADGTQGMVNIGGTADDDLPTIGQMNTAVAGVTSFEETTYSALKAKRDAGTLVKGKWYRITDYTCTTIQEDTQSAGHVFDVIVRADSTNVLNENAYAALHSSDTYFANCKLAAWQLKYSIDNDTTRFAWADSTNGKGIIYYMKDEWNNECPYDFKNIQFKRYKITGGLANTWGLNGQSYTVSTTDTQFFYTFAYLDGNVMYDATLKGNDGTLAACDEGFVAGVYGNSIAEASAIWVMLAEPNAPTKMVLPGTIIYSTHVYTEGIAYLGCHGNIFGSNCTNNTFEDNCINNKVGDRSTKNIFGKECSYNTFGDDFNNNTLGYGCTNNTFGDNCYSNIFSGGCSYNIVDNGCSNNTIGVALEKSFLKPGVQYVKFTSSTSVTVRSVTVESGVIGSSSSNQLELYDTDIANKTYPITITRESGTNGKYLMKWNVNGACETGKYKATATAASWTPFTVDMKSTSEGYVDTAIANAITTALNTPV